MQLCMFRASQFCYMLSAEEVKILYFGWRTQNHCPGYLISARKYRNYTLVISNLISNVLKKEIDLK